MNPFAALRDLVLAAIADEQAEGRLPADLVLDRIDVEPPRDPAHGDAATNAALVLAKPARQNPLQIAERLAGRLLAQDAVVAAEAVRPGFVNLRLADSFWLDRIRDALRDGERYGATDLGRGRRINVEYCSANPTGPLHVGHCRGTVFGDALSNLLAFTGWRVTREYYVNDAGAQIDTLARSVHLRYREALGEAIGAVPAGLYPGEYLKPLGAEIAAADGDAWRDLPEEGWLPHFRKAATEAMLALIKDDLARLGVHHDVFTSEAALVAADRVDEALHRLEQRGLVYTGTLPPPKGKPIEDWEEKEQLLFRSTGFGDDIDRPLKRSNGQWTYFAADVAYHGDKIERGFDHLIDVLGADHGGYVKRTEAAVAALGDRKVGIDVLLCQLVNLMDGGQPLRMSKRAGRLVTLRDVVDEVGRDVVRFIMLTRKNDAPLDFDLEVVTQQSRDNPVFYVQYAHARICSVFRNAEAAGLSGLDAASLAEADLTRLSDPGELALVKTLASYSRVLVAASRSFEPHRVAFYLFDLASAFHSLWNMGKERPELRFLLDDVETTKARLALLAAVRLVLAGGLGIVGVVPAEELH
ncbi:arginine--tRNA ligase [Marinivivus vitaminiproducens]|uniref:arginine--tRNA ligase n=1 Tax=Marinivivus vitaminiproducens TaxID=3035935 RepID=UPI0027984705|nr:arginine--tRNA ligase [Geminicoccaceae bacterium SCSIO 64248]